MDNELMVFVKNELERMSCPIHSKNPTVLIEGDSFNINACCEDFHKVIDGEIENAITKYMDNRLNNLFED